MRKVAIPSCLVSLAIGASFHTNVRAEEIWVVTDHAHIVRAPKATRVIYLDEPERITSELNAELPSDPARAAFLVKKRLRQGGDALQRRLALAYQGVVDAWKLQIRKIPAVIVDQRYVVYGDSDTANAIARIREYRRTHP